MASAKMVTYNVNGTRFEVDSRYQPIKPVGKGKHSSLHSCTDASSTTRVVVVVVGAYGLVCSAQDLLTSKKVAIKKVLPV